MQLLNFDPKIEVPAAVQSLLYQAIQARKRCAAWIHRVSSEGVSADVKKSNDAHEHFIKVLEIIFHVLEPRFEIIDSVHPPSSNFDPKIEVPAAVQSLLYQAIQARKRCAAWIHRVSSEGVSADVKKSNDAHEHFIKVLEIIFHVLEPRFEIIDSVHPPSSTTAPSSNRFEQLEVEDISQETLDSIPSVPAYRPKEESSTTSNDEYELEPAFESDLQFIVYCAYEDLLNLEKFLFKIWSEVKEGSLEPRTAALITNISLRLVRNIEDDVIALSPARFSQNSHRSITGIIHLVPKFKIPSPGPSFTHDMLPISSKVEDFTYQPSSQLLEKYRLYFRHVEDSFAVAPIEFFNFSYSQS